MCFLCPVFFFFFFVPIALAMDSILTLSTIHLQVPLAFGRGAFGTRMSYNFGATGRRGWATHV